MTVREHYVAGERPDWLAPRKRPMARRRNQYTPILDRPRVLALLTCAVVAIFFARAYGVLT